jgi:hypothetical protein
MHQKLLYERATWRMYRRISSSRDQAESLEQAEESAGENDTTSPPGASAAVAAVPPPPAFCASIAVIFVVGQRGRLAV